MPAERRAREGASDVSPTVASRKKNRGPVPAARPGDVVGTADTRDGREGPDGQDGHEERGGGELTAWDGLVRVHSRLSRELERALAAAHAMALVEYEVLSGLTAVGGSLRMSDLAAAAGLSRSGVTRVADVLEEQKLLRRAPSPADGRVVIATITEAGRARLAVAKTTHDETVRAILAPLTPKQARTLTKVWAALEPA